MEAAREQVLDELLGFLGKGEKVPDAVWHAFAFSFGEDGAVAMRFVDSRCVFCYVGRESSRRVFEVKADQVAALGRWFVLPNGFCSCQMTNQLLTHKTTTPSNNNEEPSSSSSEAPLCAHRLAVKIATVLKCCEKKVVEDSQLSSFLLHLHETFF